MFRFGKESVEFLCEKLLPEREENRGGTLISKKRMEIFLYHVANLGFQKGVAEVVGVHHTVAI